MPQAGTVTINGGYFEGDIGIVAMQGVVNVNGGTIVGVGSGEITVGASGTLLPAGAAIVVDNTVHDGGYAELAKVNLRGGVFDSDYKTGLVSMGENLVDYYDVSAGAYSKPFDPRFIKDENELEIRIGDTYYVGHTAIEAVEEVKDNGGAEVEVLQGDLSVEGADVGFTVKNSGEGEVSVNGHEVASHAAYTVVEEVKPPVSEAGDTEKEIENPDTGDEIGVYVSLGLMGLVGLVGVMGVSGGLEAFRKDI